MQCFIYLFVLVAEDGLIFVARELVPFPVFQSVEGDFYRSLNSVMPFCSHSLGIFARCYVQCSQPWGFWGCYWKLLRDRKQYAGSGQAEKVIMQGHQGVLCSVWWWLNSFCIISMQTSPLRALSLYDSIYLLLQLIDLQTFTHRFRHFSFASHST